MFDILRFIDSTDIREYNKDTKFTPSQQAILIARSEKTVLEDKIDALKYLIGLYPESAWGQEGISAEDCFGIEESESFLKVVRNTLRIWEEVLQVRDDNEGVAYMAKLDEKNCASNDISSHRFFSTYALAYEYLMEEKEKYLEDEDLRKVETYGKIYRLKLNYRFGSEERYLFDNEMRLVKVFGGEQGKDDEDYGFELENYAFYMPTPFKTGDIVKAETPFYKTYYAVVPRKWEKPKEDWRTSMRVSVDVYNDEEDYFDFTDDSMLLSFSYCKEEELPEKQREALKKIRNIRNGEQDFMGLLWEYSRKNRS